MTEEKHGRGPLLQVVPGDVSFSYGNPVAVVRFLKAAVWMDFDPDFKLLGPARSEVQQVMNEAVMGPIELVRRALKMMRENLAISMWVQFTSVLPMTIVNLLIAIKAFSSVTEPFQRLLTQAGPLGDTVRAPNPVLAFLLCFVVFALKINLLRAIFFTVGSLYHGKMVTISEVFRAQPRLWKGFAITQSWGIVFEFGTLFMIGVVSPFAAFYLLPLKPVRAWTGVFVGPIVLIAQKFFFTALFQVANGVTSFEGTYGLAAVKKGWWLLKGKWKVALGLFAVLIVLRIMADYLLVIAAASSRLLVQDASSSYLEDASICKELVLWLIFVIPVIMMSLLVQVTVMTWVVFYITCKAYHHEGFYIHSDNYPGSVYELIGTTKLVNDFANPV